MNMPPSQDNNENERFEPDESPSESADTKLVRLIKTITVHPTKGTRVDEEVVNVRYYNAFNFSLLAGELRESHMTIGITSPSRGEGKTLVASNLAVSLALGLQRKTVLVDFNFITPRLHRIFDVADKPGLAEAFSNGQIYVSQTAIEHLSVLSAGSVPEFQARVLQTPGSIAERLTQNQKFHLGLDKLAAFRDVVYSLEQEFEFVIVDMPSLKTGDISVQFANQLNGLVLVVDTTKTKRKDIDDMFRQISQRQVIGFVLNRFNE